MPDDVLQLPTLSDDDQAALQRWVQQQGPRIAVTDVEPLTGGTQNIVVRVHVDGRPMVLRRPPLHPRPTSDKTMLREIAVLRTLAGTDVPHPGFIAGCEDLDVLGVVFYLMEEVDGFNPGNEVSHAYVRDADLRHDVGLSYAASLARLGNAAWEGSPLAELQRPGSFLARQVPQFLRLLESYRHDRYEPESLPAVTELADWLEANRPPDSEPGIMHGDAASEQCAAAPGQTGVGGVRRLGDVHDRRPAARPRLDAGVLAARAQHDQRRGRTGRARRARQPARTARGLLGAPAGARRRRLDWYMAMACFKLGIVIEGTWSRYLAGQASREAGSGCMPARRT